MNRAADDAIAYAHSGVNGPQTGRPHAGARTGPVPSAPPPAVRVVPLAVDPRYASVRHTTAAGHRRRLCASCAAGLPASGWLVCLGSAATGFNSMRPLCPSCSAAEPSLAALRRLVGTLDALGEARSGRLREFGIVSVHASAKVCALCTRLESMRQPTPFGRNPFEAIEQRADHEIGFCWNRDSAVLLCPGHVPDVLESVMDAFYGRRRGSGGPAPVPAETPHRRRERVRQSIEWALQGAAVAGDGIDPTQRQRLLVELASYVSGADDGRDAERARFVIRAMKQTFSPAGPGDPLPAGAGAARGVEVRSA